VRKNPTPTVASFFKQKSLFSTFFEVEKRIQKAVLHIFCKNKEISQFFPFTFFANTIRMQIIIKCSQMKKDNF